MHIYRMLSLPTLRQEHGYVIGRFLDVFESNRDELNCCYFKCIPVADATDSGQTMVEALGVFGRFFGDNGFSDGLGSLVLRFIGWSHE